jgi:single-strand DNA-binding protein
MKAFGLARLGRDIELRYIPSGEAVGKLSLAFDRRVKGEKVTDWVEGTLWGKRAEALAPYLLKGGLVSITLDEIHIETYEGKNGPGHKLAAKVIDMELAGGGQAPQRENPEQKRPEQAPRQQEQGGYRTSGARPMPAGQPARQAPAPHGGGFDDMESDIPF